jgi:hypothetical protein
VQSLYDALLSTMKNARTLGQTTEAAVESIYHDLIGHLFDRPYRTKAVDPAALAAIDPLSGTIGPLFISLLRGPEVGRSHLPPASPPRGLRTGTCTIVRRPGS